MARTVVEHDERIGRANADDAGAAAAVRGEDGNSRRLCRRRLECSELLLEIANRLLVGSDGFGR